MVPTSESRIEEDKDINVQPHNSPRHRKVLARWDPAKPQRPVIDEAPVFHPSPEEFEDTLAYIEKIRPLAEPFGICRIVPPSSWSPPCRLKEQSVWVNTKFPTRIQNVHLLQNRDPINKKEKPKGRKRKRRRVFSTKRRLPRIVSAPVSSLGTNGEDKFGFKSGSEFTLDEFEKYAGYFKKAYFERKEGDADKNWTPSVEEVEGEYWRIIEQPTYDVGVYYGADLENRVLGSGFGKRDEKLTGKIGIDRYTTSGWNLNNLSRLPGSLLSFEHGDISGVLVPWMYVGMCFSTFCWHVEDHHLYSMNYHHFGEPKVWYGVPGSQATSFEKAMKEYLPDLFEETPDLLHGLITQFAPSIIKEKGVPVYRTVQHAGEYVVTFPRAYHSGFNSGFNCAEAVNVGPVDWLSYGQNAVELYSEESRKTSLSHDKLLLGAAYEAVRSLWGGSTKDLRWESFCGKSGTLTKAVETRFRMEEARLEALGNGFSLVKMEKDFDSDSEKECIKCCYDLHLTASGCNKCSPGEYACTKHAYELCSCEGNDRFVLLRHTMDELRSLVRALEGEAEDLKTWASMVIEDYSETQKGQPSPVIVEEATLKESGFDLNLDVQVDGEVNNTSETQKGEPSPVIVEEKTLKERGFDLNLDVQMDDEFDNTSETRKDASMMDFVADVEPIDLGFLVYGKLWCNKHAIFPKGFKSRVKFYNVKDPMRISYYISEVVDAGLIGPLFRVTLEDSQDVSFSAGSAQECWDMVLERVKEEIKKRSSQEQTVPTLESIDGLQMFGFLSPSIIQATEDLDPNHRLVEYWNHKKQMGSLEVKDCFMSN